MEQIKRITSFEVDHDFITPGVYISRIDGDVTTFDIRTRTPNNGDYMDNSTMHSFEHMFATFIRNSSIADNVIYFGPMGCQTGFYLLTRDVAPDRVFEEIKLVLNKIIAHDGCVFGASRKECGNYMNLDLAKAKEEATRFINVIGAVTKNDFSYPKA